MLRRAARRPPPSYATQGDRPRGESVGATSIAETLQQAVAVHQAGHPKKALQLYESILAVRSNHPTALNLGGVANFELGDGERAIELLRRAIATKPDYAQAHYNLGNAFQRLGRYEEAATAYRRATKLQPDNLEAHRNLGIVLHLLGRFEEAVAACRVALQLTPDDSTAHAQLGNALQAVGDLRGAISAYGRALEINPDRAEIHHGLGHALQALGEFGEAEMAYRRALDIRHDNADVHNNLGTVLAEQARLDSAVRSFRHALEITPDHAEAHYNLGNVFRERGDPDNAIDSHERALSANPDHARAAGELLHQLQHVCDWGRVAKLSAKLDALTEDALAKGKKTGENPFVNIARCDDLARNLDVARSWATDITRRTAAAGARFSFAHRLNDKGKIRLGYLSGDFRDHPLSHVMQGVFGLHDRDRFSVFAYSHGPDDCSDYRRRIAEDCDTFVDIAAYRSPRLRYRGAAYLRR